MHPRLYCLLFAGARLSLAAQVGYFDSTKCADASGFATCYDDADEWWADCINKNCAGQNIDCHNACECVRQGAYTRCAVSSCWNMVYSCEYQLQVADKMDSCIKPDLDQTPFWPPPDNANGRCSCNIGKITTAQVLTNEVVAWCGDLVDPFTQSSSEIESIGKACLCCGYSGLLSSLASFCPKLDPAELKMDGLEQLLANHTSSLDWNKCAQYMSGHDCAADFKYPSSIEKYYGPGQIPKGGTETLHNINALTTPVSATVTFTMGTLLLPVTAVSTSPLMPTASSDNGKSSDSSKSSDSNNDNKDSTQGNSGGEQATPTQNTKGNTAVHQIATHPLLVLAVVIRLGIVWLL
ncbi:uncharacterized protein ACLA_093960 [Aspergillus clavatus NRRL 1]|uniref:Secreted protein n=1 Tax=Aspergillus clavatus (strain ATCC 1007 / CBS 513.65 / DSM 816 / NCTC 3887 / NRRL 1 / QM 1276 / 107) TaxID=344612 RepID=A1CFP8_ASPCL|nr:uncharacterized protein ACLA_093960 [Aspergillus clavatus NRRL 1]EAW11697.1 conserved hypothetical protein [Aspergillus clavatus NRRL 1]